MSEIREKLERITQFGCGCGVGPEPLCTCWDSVEALRLRSQGMKELADEALALLPPEEETRQSSESPHDWIERMWHIRNSDQWGEEIKAQSERWVQDSSDRKLLLVDSWNEGDLYKPMQKASNIAYGEYVALDDFQALAERFVLAWELITTSEKEPEPAPSSEKALRDALTSLDVIENTLDEMKEWDTGHPNKAVVIALFELRSIRALLASSPAPSECQICTDQGIDCADDCMRPAPEVKHPRIHVTDKRRGAVVVDAKRPAPEAPKC